MSESTRQLAALGRARVRAAANRLADLDVSRYWILAAAVAVGAAAVVFAGFWAAPALMAPPSEVATGGLDPARRRLPPGTNALEAAFWATVLTGAVLNFRVVDLLFRRSDVRVLDPFPVRASSLMVDRIAAAAAEAAAAALAIGLFFAPLVWRGEATVASLCWSVVVAGLAGGVCSGFAVQLFAGRTGLETADDGDRRSADMYGGPGQIFLLSPALAFAMTAVGALVARLLAGEVLYPDPPLGAVRWGIAIYAAGCLGLLTAAGRVFSRQYGRIAAAFREADLTSFRPGSVSSTDDLSEASFGEGLLGTSARPVYRAAVRQYGRRYVLVRYGYVAGWVGAAVALAQLSPAAFPAWAVVALPTVAATALFNPWRRVDSAPITPESGRVLPIRDRDLRAGIALAAGRELLLVTAPYSVSVVVLEGPVTGWLSSLAVAAGAMAAVLASNGLVGLVRARGMGGPLATVALPSAVAIGAAASAARTPFWAAAVWGGVAAATNAALLADRSGAEDD